MAQFELNSWVWIEHDEEKYLPAKVLKPFRQGEATIVMTEDGENHKLSEASTLSVIEWYEHN